jgi:hypothetical protein
MAYLKVVQWGVSLGRVLPMLMAVNDVLCDMCCVLWVPTQLPRASVGVPAECKFALDCKGAGGSVPVKGQLNVLLN